MDTQRISVITPVYNVETYIEQYLDSLLNQTYDNLEIICIDDGSSDKCGNILDDYAAKDSRIKVVHQSNMGYACAINRGLDIITGDYVGFCDPDDWIEPDFYENAVNLAGNFQADIVITNFYREYTDKSEKMNNYKPIPAIFDNSDAAFCYGFEADVYRGFKMFVWNKLFRSSFFIAKNNNGTGLRMCPKMNTGGDVLLTSKCFLMANKFAYTSKALYHYRIRENSLVRNPDFSRRVGLNSALEQIACMLEQEQFKENTINLVKRFHTYYCSQLAEFAYSIGDKYSINYSKTEMRKYLDEYIESSSQHPERISRINKILEMVL